MRSRPRPFNVAYGVLHLLGASFWTPLRHQGKIEKDRGNPEDAISEADLRDIMDHWGEQQRVAWALARTLAWTALLWLAKSVVG